MFLSVVASWNLETKNEEWHMQYKQELSADFKGDS
jgi:hypothetical protein